MHFPGAFRRVVTVSAVAVAATLSAAATRPATATVVDFDVPAATVTGVATVANARYMINTTGWDLAIKPAGTVVDALTLNAGDDLATFSGQSFAFSLVFTTGQGYTWTVGAFPAVSWTTDIYGGIGPTERHEAIDVRVSVGYADVTAALANLAFSSPTLGTSGTLRQTMSAAVPTNMSDQQWLVADGDLSLHDWTLTGSVVLSSADGLNPRGNLTLDVTTHEFVDPVPIAHAPVPAALPLFGAGLAALGLVARARRRTR